MSDITQNIGSGAEIITNIIQWFTGFLGRLSSGLGMLEIMIFMIVGFIIYLFFNQHLLPQKVYKP